MLPTPNLTQQLFQLPIFEAEWVLWLLVALSVVSVSVMLERLTFFGRRRIDPEVLELGLLDELEAGTLEGALERVGSSDGFEAHVVAAGLRAFADGERAAEHAMSGIVAQQRIRYQRGLGFLASVGSNAPFIGLFGTVLGIIKAFQDLSTDMEHASGAVMSGISEALIATAVGLLVAIPAVLAFNALSARIETLETRARQFSCLIVARLAAKEN